MPIDHHCTVPRVAELRREISRGERAKGRQAGTCQPCVYFAERPQSGIDVVEGCIKVHPEELDSDNAGGQGAVPMYFV